MNHINIAKNIKDEYGDISPQPIVCVAIAELYETLLTPYNAAFGSTYPGQFKALLAPYELTIVVSTGNSPERYDRVIIPKKKAIINATTLGCAILNFKHFLTSLFCLF
jgi:hypothetical protein